MARRKKVNGNGKFRSRLESNTADNLPAGFDYELCSYPYILRKRYVPDFIKEDTWLEVKGYFRPGDVAKYKAIRADHPDKRLIFVFSNPRKKVRKNAKMTMGEWALKHGWEYTTVEEVNDYLCQTI